ncbi:MAG: exodeoxyribonuclease VII small subunit [Clostridia bacterium]|nr:exodeoxyribonuclease VII small subunit [Clostridia bacterium]
MNDLSFEEAINELEKTVNALEVEKLTLEESVKKFQKGMELSKYCNELLDKAEKDITILIEQSSGEMKAEKFELEGNE